MTQIAKLKYFLRTFKKVFHVFLVASVLVSWVFYGWPQAWDFPPTVQEAFAAQFARPDADDATGSWTATPLWSKVEEGPSGDGTEISSETVGNNSDTSVANLSLSSVTDPQSSSGHVIRVRWRNGNEGGSSRTIGGRVQLRQGTTNIALLTTTSPAGSSTFVEDTYTLSSAEANAITDYSNLNVQVWGRGTSGGTARSIRVDYVELETPNAPVFTTLADGTDPSRATIAPGDGATDIDQFTFTTSSGTDSVTALNVTLSTSGATTTLFDVISKVEVTNTSNSDVCTDITSFPTTSTTLSFSCSGISATTGGNTYKIRITPESHSGMPSPRGEEHAITAVVSNWTGTNSHAGTDTNSAEITIDNYSPGNVGTANDGSDWDIGTSAANYTWRSVAYGNGLFVAVSSNGTPDSNDRVMTSPDGIVWTLRNSAVENSWTSVTYGNGLFVAVSSSGTGDRVMTSPDGINWTSRTSAADNFWSSVAYGNGFFVAVSSSGSGNRVMTSPDGITWTSRTSAADLSWNDVTYGEGIFVAVATNGTNNDVMTSPDGITWTQRATPSGSFNWDEVVYGNGGFVAISGGISTSYQVMTSQDGTSWTGVDGLDDIDSWDSVAFGNGLFVAFTFDEADTLLSSFNGEDWTTRTPAASNSWGAITYGDDRFVAVSTSGTGNRAMVSTSTLGAVVATGGDTQVSLSWTNPGDFDLSKILVVASTSAITDDPTEGASSYATSSDFGSGYVACYGLQTSCTDSSLTNGVEYYYKIFTMDQNGNFSESGATPSGSPTTPMGGVVSISVSDGIIAYGPLTAGQATSTHSAALNDTQTVTNTGGVNVLLEIQGTNTACPWTLASSAGSDQYVHQFCKASDVSCTSPPTNYTALTTNLQTLYTSVPHTTNNARDVDLRITVPSTTSCYTEQSVDVVIQATAE